MSTSASLSSRLYLAFWRWHFWMGLLISPVIILVSITGALYVFKSEMERFMYPELMFKAEPGQHHAGFDGFEAAIHEHNPNAELHHLNVSRNPSRAWQGYADEHFDDGTEEVTQYFYDPSTGKLLGTLNNDTSFFRVVLGLHRRLLVGTPGRLVVETATCWGIVTVLTGLWLWWPRKKEKLWGVWLPRIRGGFRTVLRDWHTVPAVYVSLLVIAIMVTGLLFTQIWGQATRAGVFVSGGFPEFFVSPPQSDLPEAEADRTRLSIDDAAGAAFAHYDFAAQSYSISLPHDEKDAIQFIGDTSRPVQGFGVVHLDQYNGETLVFATDKDIPLASIILLLFYPIHVGSIFGLTTKILAVLCCLLLVAMSITGVWMWWRRKPAGKFGEPRQPPAGTSPRWLIAITIVLGILLPTVGLTLVLLALISWIAGRFKRRTAAA